MITKGTFETRMTAEPPYDVQHGVSLGRASFDKTFTGSLTGTSKVHMLAARTPVEGSAGYVALERIEGVLDGKSGSFACMHMGTGHRGARSLVVNIVPDSGTGELTGIAGRMNIEIVSDQHFYEVDYTLEAAP